MPKIKLSHVVSFSSEDVTNVAQNLLSPDTVKKWKCGTPGEKSATVVLQLEKACVISGIDIGNEHSAYIEVLVSRSSNADDFKVILVMSSFMTPTDSRQSINVNKVRMFNTEHLSKPVCNEKWDRVKIVCTQPFNKHVQYGLSFVTFHSPESKEATSNTVTLGKFVLREPSPDIFSAGSLFAKRKQSKDNEPVSAATAIRQASDAPNSSPSPKLKIKHSLKPKKDDVTTLDTSVLAESRNRNELLYNEDETESNDKIDRLIEKKNKEIREKQEKFKEEEKQSKKKTAKENVKLNAGRSKNVKEEEEKDASSTKKKQNGQSTSDEPKRKITHCKETVNKKIRVRPPGKPFNQLLEGVVLVISGIQNPDRANLRSMALSMGARYKADWDNTCTHLICAFPNTPKFHQVRGKGKIITRKWIEECSSQRKRLPWRRFALDKSDKGKAESEEEICEQTSEEKAESEEETCEQMGEKIIEPSESACQDAGDESEKDVASDTEERIAKIEREQIKNNNNSDPYLEDTDKEDSTSSVKQKFSDKLASFFSNKLFYIDNSFDNKELNLLKRYVVAYKGFEVESPSGDIDYVITRDKKMQSSSNMSENALYVVPQWIWACHNAQKLVPVEDYILR